MKFSLLGKSVCAFPISASLQFGSRNMERGFCDYMGAGKGSPRAKCLCPWSFLVPLGPGNTFPLACDVLLASDG